MIAAWEHGVNFFDNAEGYAEGNAEIVMGNVLKKLGWKREEYVVSTKVFWGGNKPNQTGLSHKHVIEGVNNALTPLPARVRRPVLLPPARPGHADRRDGAGDGHPGQAGQDLLLGHVRVERGARSCMRTPLPGSTT